VTSALLRRDPLVRSLRWSMAQSLTISVFMSVLLAFLGGRMGQGGASSDRLLGNLFMLLAAPPVFLGVLGVFGQSTPLTRSTEFHLALPVAFRTQWLAHLVAHAATVWLPLVPLALVGVVFLDSVGAKVLVLQKLAALGAAFFALAAVVQSVRPTHVRWTPGPMAVAVVGLLGAGLLAAAVLTPGPWFALATSAGAMGLAVRTWTRLPVSVDVAVERATAGRVGVTPNDGSERAALGRFLRRLTLADGGFGAVLALVVFAATAFVFAASSSIWPWVVLYSTINFLRHGLQRVLSQTLHLPMRRRLVFACVALPVLLWAALGLGAAQAGYVLLQQPFPDVGAGPLAVKYHDHEPHYVIEVPAELWRLTTADAAPEIRRLSGSVRPTVHRFIESIPLGAYNPYDAGPRPTGPFIAEQLSHAIRDAHGVEIAPAELQRRYLSRSPESHVFVNSRMLYRDYPQLPRRPWPRASWLLLVLAWWACLAVMIRDNTPPASRRQWRWRMFGQIVMGCSVVVAFFAVALADIWRPEVAGAILGRLGAVLDALLPADATLPAALIVAVAAAVFLLNEGRIARMEVPPEVKPYLWRHMAPRAE